MGVGIVKIKRHIMLTAVSLISIIHASCSAEAIAISQPHVSGREQLNISVWFEWPIFAPTKQQIVYIKVVRREMGC